MTLAILAGIAGVLVFFVIFTYNGLVRARNLVQNAFSQIDVQLRRRFDLIPNLVETAKAYMKHESETLEAVIKARNQAFQAVQSVSKNATDAAAMKQLLGAEGLLSQELAKVMLVVENYPDLKANTSMSQVMEELSSTENKISFARQAFNDSVMDYNNKLEIFPAVLFAASLGFKQASSYQVEEATVREPVKVQFST